MTRACFLYLSTKRPAFACTAPPFRHNIVPAPAQSWRSNLALHLSVSDSNGHIGTLIPDCRSPGTCSCAFWVSQFLSSSCYNADDMDYSGIHDITVILHYLLQCSERLGNPGGFAANYGKIHFSIFWRPTSGEFSATIPLMPSDKGPPLPETTNCARSRGG